MNRATPPGDAEDELTGSLRRVMAAELAGGATKRSAVRVALVSAITGGDISPGERLPPETALAKLLDVSLGTVQAALGQVNDLGMIERRRGDGTRVLDAKTITPRVWHFRFLYRESGKVFRPFARDAEVLQSSAEGRWSRHLGACGAYTVIRRVVLGENETRLHAEMTLSADLAPAGLLNPGDLKASNIRTVIEQKLGVRATHVEHTVAFGLPDQGDRLLAWPPATLQGSIMLIAARTFIGERPFYYQDIYAPADQLSLEF